MICAALPLCAATPAYAFRDPSTYAADPTDPTMEGGGGGRWFTGSPADGYGCSVCHTAATPGSYPVYQTGLPLDGYVPGMNYEIKLAWPQAANRITSGTPATSLNAEFVAEDGSGSGRLQIQPQFATSTELCKQTAGVAEQTLAGSIYTITAQPGSKPTSGLDCNATARGDRCVVTVRDCGSALLKMTWTAPTEWHGPIWFSLGFVTTDNMTGRPNDYDYVTEQSYVMNAASDGPPYTATLDGGCSAFAQRGAARWPGLSFYALGLGLLCLQRRRRRANATRSHRTAAALRGNRET